MPWVKMYVGRPGSGFTYLYDHPTTSDEFTDEDLKQVQSVAEYFPSGEVAADATINVTYTKSDGTAIAGKFIRLTGDAISVSGATDDKGKVSFKTIAGTFNVLASDSLIPNPTAVTVAAGATKEVSIVDSSVTMSLRAADLAAAKLPGWALLQSADDQSLFETATDADGNAIPDPAFVNKFCDPALVTTGASTLIPGATWLQDWDLVPGEAGDAGRNGDPNGIPDNSYWIESVRFKLAGDIAKSGTFAISDFNVDDRTELACLNGTRLFGRPDPTYGTWSTKRQFIIPAGVMKTDGTDNLFTIVGFEGGGGAGFNQDTGGPRVIGVGGGVTPPVGVKGDINGDSKVDIKDATISLAIAVGTRTNATPA